MSHYYHASTIAALKIIADIGPITIIDLAAEAGVSRELMKARVDNLHSKGLVESGGKNGALASYFATTKGRRLLRSMSEPDVGSFPSPRGPLSKETYVPKPIVTRPGSEDFLRCPSRRGDSFVEHRLPISMAGGAD